KLDSITPPGRRFVNGRKYPEIFIKNLPVDKDDQAGDTKNEIYITFDASTREAQFALLMILKFVYNVPGRGEQAIVFKQAIDKAKFRDVKSRGEISSFPQRAPADLSSSDASYKWVSKPVGFDEGLTRVDPYRMKKKPPSGITWASTKLSP